MSKGSFIAGSQPSITKTTVGLGSVDNTSDVNKPISTAQQAALNLKMNTSDFIVHSALPGLPISDVAMAILPNLSVVSIDASAGVSNLTDPLTGTALVQSDATQRPKLAVDSSGRSYMEFNNSRVFSTGVSASSLAGPNGNTTTFMIVAKTSAVRDNTHFQWAPADGSSFSTTNRIGVHLPWNNGDLYVDHGNISGGRLQAASVSNIIGQLTSYIYVRDGGTARLYKDGTLVQTTTGLTATVSSATGRFMLGDDNVSQAGYHANMDFYGLFFYGRALTAEELQKMFLFSRQLYGV